MKRRRLSPAEKLWIASLHRQGYSTRGIAKVIGLAVGTVAVFKMRRMLVHGSMGPNDVEIQKDNGIAMRATDAEIMALVGQGMTAPEIAQRLGYDRSSISRRMRGLGVQPRGVGRPRKVEAPAAEPEEKPATSWRDRFFNPEDRRAGR